MLKFHLSEVTSYAHDTLPVPYCGTGEEYSVFPGNVRTTRHHVSLEVKFDSGSHVEVVEMREKLMKALAGLGADVRPL